MRTTSPEPAWRPYTRATAAGKVKTTLTARITIDESAWRRVCSLAARQRRLLPVVIGELLDEASLEPVPDVPDASRAYTPHPLLRLWIRRHPDTMPDRD